MRQKLLILIFLSLLANLLGQDESWKYLGQKPPSDIPQIFAKGIISTKHMEHSSPTFSPDLKEVFWSVIDSADMMIRNYYHIIMYMKYDNGKWSEPDTAFFSGKYDEDGPMFSSDGRRLYFSRELSDTVITENWSLNNNLDIFYIEKEINTWAMPVNIEFPINTEKVEWQPSISKNNNIYFSSYLKGVKLNSGIYCSEYKNGTYQKPYALPLSINSSDYDWTPYIARDESYIIFSSSRNPENNGNDWGDLYISFKVNDREWSDAIYMGDPINTRAQERFPYVSPDGKYLFFKRGRYKTFGNVMWVNAGIIERLREQVKNKR